MASEDFDRYEVLDQQIEMLKAKKAHLENLILFARGIKFSGGGKYIMSGIRAKYIPRIDLHDPVELKEAIPLRTPYVIYIDPCDTCNFRCKFCPSGNLDLMKKTPGRGHEPMGMTLYKEIIDSLSEFKDPIRVIRLYKEGEPLLNPHFAEMVRYAKASPKVLRVDTTTNGALLTPERSLEIINAGLDRINISVEGMDAQQYKEFSGINLDYEKYVENISFFYAQFRSNTIIALALQVMRAGVAAVIFDVVLNLAKNVIKTRRWLHIGLMAGAFVAKVFFGVEAMVLILVCLAVGIGDLLVHMRADQKKRATEVQA